MASYTIKENTLADGASLAETSPRKMARDSSGNLYAVYYRNDGTRNQVYISKSANNGVDWTEYKVTDDAIAHINPSIAIDSNDYIYVMCVGVNGYASYDQLQCAKSINAGVDWSLSGNINEVNRDYYHPAIAIDSNDYLHVVSKRSNTSNYGILYIKSEDSAASWSAVTQLAETSTYYQEEVAIAIDSNNYLHIAFIGKHAGSSTYYQLRYRKYTDSWQDIENLTSDNSHKRRPSIAIDSNDYIHIAYQEQNTYYHIYYIYNNGSWQAEEDITTGNYNHYYPSISVDDDNEIYVVFYGYHSGSTTYRQIGINHYTDSWSGISWLTSGNIDNRYSNLIFARWPVDGTAKVNIPATGYAFIWASDDDIKIELSADLVWQSGVTIITFEDSGSGSDSALTDKIINILDSGSGVDNLKVDKIIIISDSGSGVDVFSVIYDVITKIFSDSGAGTDVILVDKTQIFSDSGEGLDQYLANKLREFIDSGAGVDKFLKDWTPIFSDSGSGVEAYYKVFHYPANLKRVIILIRDKK